MSTIKVTPEQLHHVSSQVDQARQQLEHIQDNLSRQIMFLQAMWMGVTQERFYDDFARSRPVLQKALESMVFTSKELKDIAIRFENADAEKVSLGGVIGAVGAAAMMKSTGSDAGSGDKGYRMKKVNVYGRYVWVPVNENGELDYTAVQAYAKDQGNVNIDRMQGVHTEAPEEDIFKMQVKSLENRIHPFTGEPVSDKYAQMMLTSLKFSQIFMAFQMVRGSMPGRKGPFRLPASDPAVAKIKKNLEAGEAGKGSNIKGIGETKIFSAGGNAELRATRRPAFDNWMENGLEVNDQRFKMNQHAYNSLFKSGRKDIMPQDITAALGTKPTPGNPGSVVYTNPATGTKVYINPSTQEIVGVQPGSFKD